VAEARRSPRLSAFKKRCKKDRWQMLSKGMGVICAAAVAVAATGGTVTILQICRKKNQTGRVAVIDGKALLHPEAVVVEITPKGACAALDLLTRALRANAADYKCVALDATAVANAADDLVAAIRTLEEAGAEARGEVGAHRRADGATPTRALSAALQVNRAARYALDALRLGGADVMWAIEFAEQCELLRQWTDDEVHNASVDVAATLKRH
jgi:hypothetical protein